MLISRIVKENLVFFFFIQNNAVYRAEDRPTAMFKNDFYLIKVKI